MGLEIGNDNAKTTYLSIAGGYIWDKKADSSHPAYKEQEWKDNKGNSNIRKGAAYKSYSGKISDVAFSSHESYGDSLLVTFEDGGEKFVFSVPMNKRNSQDFLKAILKIDLNKEVKVLPYYFEKDGKTKQGINFYQDNEKVDTFNLELEGFEFKSGDWFAKAKKSQVTMYFLSLTETLQENVEEKIKAFKESSESQEDVEQVEDVLDLDDELGF